MTFVFFSLLSGAAVVCGATIGIVAALRHPQFQLDRVAVLGGAVAAALATSGLLLGMGLPTVGAPLWSLALPFLAFQAIGSLASILSWRASTAIRRRCGMWPSRNC